MARGLMDANIFGASTEDEEARALSDSLRQRNDAQSLFALSTIKPLAAGAQQAQQDTVAASKQAGLLRKAALAAEAKKEQDSAQMNLDERKLKQALAIANADRTSRSEIAANALAEKAIDYNKIPIGEQQKTRSRVADTDNLLDLIDTTEKVDVSNPAMGIPGAGSASNIITQKSGWASDDMEDRASFWREYKRLVESPARHELYGGALTAGEIAEWRLSTVNPNMSDTAIKEGLAKQARLSRIERQREEELYKANKVDPDIVASVFKKRGSEDSAAIARRARIKALKEKQARGQ